MYFKNTKNNANNKNEIIIPIEVIKKLSLIFLLSVLSIESNLIDKTGKTQGIKFKIKPPTNEINSK